MQLCRLQNASSRMHVQGQVKDLGAELTTATQQSLESAAQADAAQLQAEQAQQALAAAQQVCTSVLCSQSPHDASARAQLFGTHYRPALPSRGSSCSGGCEEHHM